MMVDPDEDIFVVSGTKKGPLNPTHVNLNCRCCDVCGGSQGYQANVMKNKFWVCEHEQSTNLSKFEKPSDISDDAVDDLLSEKVLKPDNKKCHKTFCAGQLWKTNSCTHGTQRVRFNCISVLQCVCRGSTLLFQIPELLIDITARMEA